MGSKFGNNFAVFILTTAYIENCKISSKLARRGTWHSGHLKLKSYFSPKHADLRANQLPFSLIGIEDVADDVFHSRIDFCGFLEGAVLILGGV